MSKIINDGFTGCFTAVASWRQRLNGQVIIECFNLVIM